MQSASSTSNTKPLLTLFTIRTWCCTQDGSYATLEVAEIVIGCLLFLQHSQQVLKEDETGMIIRIYVVLNFELEREILGFGECMKVLGPRLLASKIRHRLSKAVNGYEVTPHQTSPGEP